MVLVQANPHLIINVDAIAAASWDQEENCWRVLVVGHNKDMPTIRLSSEEMTRILDNVETPKMVAILRAAGGTHRGTKSAPKRPDNGQQETH